MNPNQKNILDELLSKSDLDTKITFFIAKKDKEAKDINKELINIMTKRILKKFSIMAGGANISKSKGAYYSINNKLLMYEDNYIITCYMSMDIYDKNQINIYNMAIDNNNFLNQESTLILINDYPLFITDRKEIKEEKEEIKYEKEVIEDLNFKTFYNYDNMLKYIDSHLIFSTYPILQHGGDDMKYTEGSNLDIGDIIFIFHKYSSYSYDCIYKITGITNCYIKYKRIIYNPILKYMNNNDYGQSKQVYKYSYNICHVQEYRKKKDGKMYLKLDDKFKNSDFIYITRFLH